MTHKEVIKALASRDIPLVVIGGVAMRLYNSPRVTHDLDIVVRFLDLEAVVGFFYDNGYFLVERIEEESILVFQDAETAMHWVDAWNPGSLSFLLSTGFPEVPQNPEAPGRMVLSFQEIDPASQVDVLFDLSIPFMRLQRNAHTIELEDLRFHVAAPEDLIALKEARSDRSSADDDDIRFLRERFGL